MRYRVLPYRQGSRSAKALANKLGGKVLKLEGSTYVPRAGDMIINWGNTDCQCSTIGPATVVNHGGLIRNASNKLLFFQMMKETGCEDIIPEFWTSQSDIPDTAFPVVCRTVLAGHSGDGIVIANSRDDLVPASLYVRYVKKQDEYRVHVGMRGEHNGYPYSEGHPYPEVIAVQRKARRIETPDEDVNWQVRNHANGFVFVRNGVAPPAGVLEVARKALEASGLDFGAVDAIWNKEKQRAYVLEINTAPGLEGQTIDDYANFFKAGAA